jgi:hypothetical protein
MFQCSDREGRRFAFVRMRELLASNKDIAARVEKLERRHDRSASESRSSLRILTASPTS